MDQLMTQLLNRYNGVIGRGSDVDVSSVDLFPALHGRFSLSAAGAADLFVVVLECAYGEMRKEIFNLITIVKFRFIFKKKNVFN